MESRTSGADAHRNRTRGVADGPSRHFRIPVRTRKGRRQKRKARTCGPFLRFSESYGFGSGSAPKFAWTNVHLSPFFTKTRVDFARAASFFPSLSWVTPT